MRIYMGVGTKVKRLFTPSPHVKNQPLNHGENPDAELDAKSKPAGFGSTLRSPDFGSKEDVFLDSRPWLDSDCEDDFYSVNGEFTPSRGSTPNYQTIMAATPSLNKAYFVNKFAEPKSEASPTGRKKLAQFFQETLPGEEVGKEQSSIETNGKRPNVYNSKNYLPPNSVDETPYTSEAGSVSGSEVTPKNGGSNKKKRKIGKASYCCLPSLVYNFSFNERRHKMI